MQKNYYALFGFAAVAAAAAIAAYFGVLPGTAPKTPAQSPVAAVVAPSAPQIAAPQGDAPTAPAVDQQAGVTVPSFDILRVEPDGSVVIAGRAEPASNVDVIAGSIVLGSARAAENGDFAVALDQALKPGDHQLVLRATGTNSKAATSSQTAIVSVPDKNDGQVLALVEQPGEASRMITTPQAGKPAAAAPADMPTGTAQQPSGEAHATQAMPAEPQKQTPVTVEAVEIEGDTIFVAGKAVPGKRVAVYANEVMLGAAPASPDARFLVQSQRPLAVGDYIIRADLTEKDGTVIASAHVPFHREAGENIAAVAPNADNATGAPMDRSAASNAAELATGAESDTTAKPLQSVDGSVIIRKGDNLWTISKRTYGRGTRYTTIYLANADQIKNPDLILPGQVFSMPKEPLSDEEAQRRLKVQQ
ncbi:LysM peptidoglycan-binding domain-containing protein [Phyllobacterium salinisoli]|uniref:LysM peptidoglycan-binding domain-containing protein n=1 Tax=Phyllobacterium salinisoli TaxID=1899321 RepID=A0A368K495_9HYPH|nr:LysM peptidoglycan-binding domain-containing protein [Phyllobacterium salinisoli]